MVVGRVWENMDGNGPQSDSGVIKVIFDKLYIFVQFKINKVRVGQTGSTIVCDMIKGNESLVENFNSYFLAPLSHNFNMLHLDPNPITIGYLVTEL